jgi:Zn-finger in ubiquitin-hydrolases and other protein
MSSRTPAGVKNARKPMASGFTCLYAGRCGDVSCCDSSKDKHATKHFQTTTQLIMKSLEPDEDWRSCYVGKVELDFA